MAQGGVYKIECRENGRIYIGASLCISARWKEHRYHFRLGRHASRSMQADWDRYGPDAFVFSVLAYEADPDARRVLEQRYLDEFQPFGERGYNACSEVGTTRGLRLSPEQRAKLAARMRGRRHSAETRAKQAATKQGSRNPQFGRPLTDAQRAALHKRGPEHPWFGRSHTDETRQKLSLLKSEPVAQIADDGTTIKIWPTARQAAEALGLRAADTIYRAMNAPQRKAAGFHWQRAAQ